MGAIFAAIIITAIFTTAQSVYAQTKKIDIPIYERCKRNPFLLSVETYEGECIVGKQLPRKLKRPLSTPISLAPSLTSSSSSSATTLLTSQPTATLTPTPDTVTPSPAAPTIVPEQAPDTGSLNPDVLFDMVNTVRVQNGLSAFQKDDNVCSIAQSRAPEIYAEIMVNHNMHAGFYARNLPYWATENLIFQKTEAAALNWWMNEPIHRAAILSNNKYSCIACQGDACSEIFTNYLPK